LEARNEEGAERGRGGRWEHRGDRVKGRQAGYLDSRIPGGRVPIAEGIICREERCGRG